MPSCWIIEQGEYSDYRVVGIFSTKANAEVGLGYLIENNPDPYDKPEITERLLDPCINELNQGLTRFLVHFINNKASVNTCTNILGEDYHFPRGSAYYIWTTSPDHALKIAAEREAQWQLIKDLPHAP